jgi:parallel beta-helix repeat protein
LKEYVSTDSGANWTYNRTIAGGATASPVRVYNAKSDKSLEFTFCGGSFAGNFNAWGQSKSQETSTSTRPIGILLDACDLRTNPDNANGNYANIRPSNHNTIVNNTISNTSKGIALCHACTDNTIFDNTVSNNDYGIGLSGYSKDNTIYHNNFINNTNQADDTTGTNQWDKGYPSGGNYWSDYTGVNLYSGPLQDQPGSDGIGDTPYTNIGGGSGAQDNYPLMSPFDYTEYSIPLQLGWNLISLPIRQLNESIDSVLGSIAGKWDYIQTYDASDVSDHWKSNMSYRPASLNDLSTMNYLKGYWINITEPGVILTVKGDKFGSPISIPLYAGWNLVGYPTLNTTTTVGVALWGTGSDKVEVCDSTDPYRTKEVGSTYIMKPGEGYWVHATYDTTWVVNW